MQIEENKPKVLITGGHLTPALAVAEELVDRIGIESIVWVGTKYTTTEKTEVSAEYKTINSKNIRFIDLQAGKLFRKWNRFTIKSALYNLYLIPVGFIKSAFIISSEKPDIVFSAGGYLALPICFWAKVNGKDVYTHEQTLTTGLANKFIAKLSKKVFTSWNETSNDLPKEKVVYTGNPLPKNFKDVFNEPPKKLFENKLKTIMITGGNQGSHRINLVIKEVLPELLDQYNVIHQCGNTPPDFDFKTLKPLEQELSNKAGIYQVYDYDSSMNYSRQLKNCDLVISRAGANTITALALYQKMAILIPIPWASKNEQFLNANYYAKTGLAKVIHQDNFNSKILFENLDEILNFDTSSSSKEIQIPLNPEIKICDILLGD